MHHRRLPLSLLALALAAWIHGQLQSMDGRVAGAQAAETPASPAQLAPEQQDRLVEQAQKWLDRWNGQDDSLERASATLRRVLAANPKHVQARIEMARYHIKAGHIGYRNFRPGTLEAAHGELMQALNADPKSADVYVLRGHVYYLGGWSHDALRMLERAEAIGTDNPWLHINWSDALVELHRWDEAESRLHKSLAQYGTMAAPPRHVVSAVHEKLAYVYTRQGKLDAADKEYQTQIALDPQYAWARGNYARFLLFTRGNPDAAIVQAEKTIEVMDYGMVRQTLAAARYAKWAELKGRAPAEAGRHLALAEAITRDFSSIMSQAAQAISAGPAIQTLVRELMARGVPLDIQDGYGDTGLTLASHSGKLESVQILLKLGANPNASNHGGETALAKAAANRNPEVVKALAARGAQVNTRDRRERTPLMMAVINHDPETVRVLITLKADPNAPMTRGFTPLMSAALKGDEEMARVLLQGGADPTRASPDTRQTAADIAESASHSKLAALLREAERKAAPARR